MNSTLTRTPEVFTPPPEGPRSSRMVDAAVILAHVALGFGLLAVMWLDARYLFHLW